MRNILFLLWAGRLPAAGDGEDVYADAAIEGAAGGDGVDAEPLAGLDGKASAIVEVVLAGFAFSLCIELSQLLLYSRGTDIDDLLTNTAGAFMGAVLYFLIKRAGSKGKKRTAQRR